MATVPGVPSPSVGQDGGPLNVNPPAGAFNPLQGLEKIGEAAHQASDLFFARAEKMAEIQNEAAADAAATDFSMGLESAVSTFNESMKGEAAFKESGAVLAPGSSGGGAPGPAPSSPGASSYSRSGGGTGSMSVPGARNDNSIPINAAPSGAPSSALAGMMGDIEQMRIRGAAGLRSPAARDKYWAKTRHARAGAFASMSGNITQQRNAYITDTETASIKLLENDLALDGSNFDAVTGEMDHHLAIIGHTKGWGETQFEAARAEIRGGAAYSITSTLARDDPVAAQAFMDTHGAGMSLGQRADATSKIRASAENLTVSAVSDAAVANATGAAALGSRAARNNNPLNLTNLDKGSWHGQTGSDGRFARFASPEAGMAAADANLQAYANRGINTLTGIISRWAPPKENNTLAYINTVAKATGIDPNARLNMADAKVRGRILQAMAVVEGGGQSKPSGDTFDNMQANAGRVMEEIASNPALHGDPRLIAAAQQQYQNKVNDRIWAHNLGAKEAQDFILSTAQSLGITDPAQLQKVPGVLEAMSKMSEKQQITLMNSVTAEGNRWTPEKQQHFDSIMGLQVTDPQKFLNTDGTSVEGLTNEQRKSISSAQLALKKADKKGGMSDFVSKTLNRALGDPIVKLGIAPLSDDQRRVFFGAMRGQIEEWGTQNPGGKLTTGDIQKMANTLLADRKAYQAGFNPLHSTFTRPNFEVPEYWLNQKPAGQSKTWLELMTAEYGRPPSPDEIAYVYNKAN